MSYIGPAPNPGQNREVDDISSGFNGGTAAFTLQVNGQNVSPGSPNNIIVSLGGVIQNPGTDYNIAGSTITFTTNPASGLSFFGLVLGQQVDIQSLADGTSPTMSAPSITGDLSIADKIIHTGDTNTAIRFPAADTVTAETGGSERVRVDSSGKVGIGTGTIRLAEQLHVLGNGIVTSSAENTNMGLFGTFGGADLLVGTFNANNVVVRRGNTNVARFTADGFIPNGTDTAAANALDDYEEGTWTPAISGVTYSDTQGTYIKIGRTCFVTLTLNGANTSVGNTDVRITGLPFTPKVAGGEYYPANSVPLFEVSGVSLASGYNNLYLRIDDAQGNLQILVTDGESHGILTAGGGTTLNSNHSMRTSFTYETNA